MQIQTFMELGRAKRADGTVYAQVRNHSMIDVKFGEQVPSDIQLRSPRRFINRWEWPMINTDAARMAAWQATTAH